MYLCVCMCVSNTFYLGLYNACQIKSVRHTRTHAHTHTPYTYTPYTYTHSLFSFGTHDDNIDNYIIQKLYRRRHLWREST